MNSHLREYSHEVGKDMIIIAFTIKRNYSITENIYVLFYLQVMQYKPSDNIK